MSVNKDKPTTAVFTAYIRAICKSACLARTAHNSVLDGHPIRFELTEPWAALVTEMGQESAQAAVARWIDKPWLLRGRSN